MALLSMPVFQLLWAFATMNILKKLKPSRLFLKWITSGGLFCYAVPTNEKLKKLAASGRSNGQQQSQNNKNNAKHKPRAKIVEQSNEQSGVFKIQTKDLKDLTLERTPIDSRMLASIPFGEELEWIVYSASMALISLIFIEALFRVYPKTNEYNFSIVWILFVIGQCMMVLAKLTFKYFTTDETIGERSICIVSGCLFFLVALMTLLMNENYLELGLDNAIKSFSNTKNKMLNTTTTESKTQNPSRQNKAISFVLVKFFVAITCSLVGVMFTFPGLRFGQLYAALQDSSESSKLKKILFILNYLSSIVAVVIWLPIIQFKRLQEHFELDDMHFSLVRTSILIFISLFRFVLSPLYVATFLESSRNRLDRIRFQGTTTTNRDIQLAIARINNYVNVVSMQYIMPTLMCLYASILFLVANYKQQVLSGDLPVNASVSETIGPGERSTSSFFGELPSLAAAEQIMMDIRKSFSVEFFQGVSGFSMWWLHFSWLCTTTGGVIYHKYFIH